MDEDVARYLDRREGLLAAVREGLVRALDLPLPPEQIDPDAPLFDAGLALDSVDAIQLMLEIEAQTGRRLPDDLELRGALRSVNALVDFLLLGTGDDRGPAA